VIAIRAASIWRLVNHAGSSAWMPKSPNASFVPPFAVPCRRPRCCLRCLTFRGINMESLPYLRRPSVVVAAEVRRLVLLTDTALDLFFLGEQALDLGIGLVHQFALRLGVFARRFGRRRCGRGRTFLGRGRTATTTAGAHHATALPLARGLA